MVRHGRGLICLAMTGERLDELELGAMVPDNTAVHGTAFTVAIDAKGFGVTTSISAHDRACAISAAIDPNTIQRTLRGPATSSLFRARAGGVLERGGHTEAAVDLARLAGLNPAGVICEIMNDDGTMARAPDLIDYCKRHNLIMVSVQDLASYRKEAEGRGSPNVPYVERGSEPSIEGSETRHVTTAHLATRRRQRTLATGPRGSLGNSSSPGAKFHLLLTRYRSNRSRLSADRWAVKRADIEEMPESD